MPHLGKLGNAIEAGSGEADGRIDPSRHFVEHDKTVAATQCTTGRPGRTRAGCRRFSGLRRVITGSNGLLQLLDIGELRLARRHRLSRVHHMGRLISQQLRGHLQAAAASQGQFLAILQMHRHCAFGPGSQLIAGEQPVPLDQNTTRAVARHREHLTDDFTDNTDELSHVHFLRCQPLSAPCFVTENMLDGSGGVPGGLSAGQRIYLSKPLSSGDILPQRETHGHRSRIWINPFAINGIGIQIQHNLSCERSVTILKHTSDKKPSLQSATRPSLPALLRPFSISGLELSSNPEERPKAHKSRAFALNNVLDFAECISFFWNNYYEK